MNLRFKLLWTTGCTAMLVLTSALVSPADGQSNETSSRRVSSRRVQPEPPIKLTDQTPTAETAKTVNPPDTDASQTTALAQDSSSVNSADFVAESNQLKPENVFQPVSASEAIDGIETVVDRPRRTLTPIVAPEQQVAPLKKQSSSELESTQSKIAETPSSDAAAATPIADEAQPEPTRVASNLILSPLKSVEPMIKQIPILADPEAFRVKDGSTNRKWFTLQDDQASPSDVVQDTVLNQGQDNAVDDEEFRLLKRLPVSDLNQGIADNSMQKAVNYPDVPNPNLSFVASADIAPTMAENYIPSTKTWYSPNMVHRPLYFEEPNLERYGNGIGRFQPVKSGVHFFGSMLFLPYKLGTTDPRTCDYSMGHYRPGDCVPAYRHEINLNAKGMIYEGLALGTFLSL